MRAQRSADDRLRGREGRGNNNVRRHDGATARLDDGCVIAEYDAQSGALVTVVAGPQPVVGDAHRLPGNVFLTLRALVRGALDAGRLNPVSAAVPAKG